MKIIIAILIAGALLLLVLLACWVYSAVMNFVEAAKKRDDQRAMDHKQVILILKALGNRIYEIEKLLGMPTKFEELSTEIAGVDAALDGTNAAATPVIALAKQPNVGDAELDSAIQQVKGLRAKADALTGRLVDVVTPATTPAA